MEKISFHPSRSDWIFFASVRYGRNTSNGYRHQQTNSAPLGEAIIPTLARHRYEQTTTSDTEAHDIFDFMAGKDVGFGALGMKGTSVLSGGVRFAQFRSASGLAVYSDPDYINPNTGNTLLGPNIGTASAPRRATRQASRAWAPRFRGMRRHRSPAKRGVGKYRSIGA